VTGWGQEEDRKAALGSGFDDHITKPVEPARLQAVFEAVFEQAGALDR
jgi:DNA-binding response OmpR family regulator